MSQYYVKQHYDKLTTMLLKILIFCYCILQSENNIRILYVC